MSIAEFDQLLDRISELSQEQIRELRRTLDQKLTALRDDANPPLTESEAADYEAQRRLLAAGIVSEIKPSRRTPTDTQRSEPFVVEGEPISETIIRERR